MRYKENSICRWWLYCCSILIAFFFLFLHTFSIVIWKECRTMWRSLSREIFGDVSTFFSLAKFYWTVLTASICRCSEKMSEMPATLVTAKVWNVDKNSGGSFFFGILSFHETINFSVKFARYPRSSIMVPWIWGVLKSVSSYRTKSTDSAAVARQVRKCHFFYYADFISNFCQNLKLFNLLITFILM